MIINGREIAQHIQDDLINKVQALGVQPALHIFVVGESPVIESFIKYKSIFAKDIGVRFVEYRFNNGITEQELIDQIIKVTKMDQGTPGPFGVVVQLPLPDHINTQRVLDSVPIEFDVDGLASESNYIAPVAGAVREILEYESIKVQSKKALVIGKGKLVGKPVAELLTNMNAIVTIVDKKINLNELSKLCKESDLIVSGTGVPNLVTRDMITDGVVLLDAGTSTQNNSVVGDIALECKEAASYFAKTPGGIGPITVAVLFKNLIN